jgi:hypothetical protein
MLYFFTTIAKCDIDAQRDGIVLILSASVASSFTSFTTTKSTSSSSSASTFFDEYYNFHQSMPIRCNSVHICYDTNNDPGLSSLRLDMIQRLGHAFSHRVRIYDKDASNFETKNQLSTYGIPIHDIPLTETSTLKFKQHYQWIKIQEFFEKQEKITQDAIAIAVAEEHVDHRGDSTPISLSYIQQPRQVGQDQQQLGLDISMKGLSSIFDGGGCGGGVVLSSPYDQFQQQQMQHVQSYAFQQQDQQQQQMSQPLLQPSSYPLMSSCFGQQQLQQHQQQQQQQRGSISSSKSNSKKNDTTTNAADDDDEFEVTVIECPRVNDVLFHRGGKFWNDNNKFQRGNLEFMEIIESKIPLYQDTRSWKKKHEILVDALSAFLDLTDGRGRFLTNATQLKGMIAETAPDGCWIELPLNSPLLMQKVRNLLINHIRRLENRSSNLKRKASVTTASSSNGTIKNTVKTTNTAKKMKMTIKTAPMKAIPTSLLSPPTRTAGRRTLASVFDNDNTITTNSGDVTNGGDRSARLHNVVNKIVAIDDRLNREIDELFLSSSTSINSLLDESLRTTATDFGTTLMDNDDNDGGINNDNSNDIANNEIANNKIANVSLGCSI